MALRASILLIILTAGCGVPGTFKGRFFNGITSIKLEGLDAKTKNMKPIFFTTKLGFRIVVPEWIKDDRRDHLGKMIDEMWVNFKNHWDVKREIYHKPDYFLIIVHPTREGYWGQWLSDEFKAIRGIAYMNGIIVVGWWTERMDINPLGVLYHEWCHIVMSGMRGHLPVETKEREAMWEWIRILVDGVDPILEGGHIDVKKSKSLSKN